MTAFKKIRWLLLGLLVAGFLYLVSRLPVAQWSQTLTHWVEPLGFWGPVVFGLIYSLANVLMAPASILTIIAGAVFGLGIGTLAVSLAATTGAAFAFLIARYLARDWIYRRIRPHPKFAAVDQAIGRESWKIVALLRLSPLVPFNVQNYLYGLTRIQFWPCILTSWVAMLPGTFMYVYLGYMGRVSLESLHQGGIQRGPLQWAMLAIGLLATVAVLWYVSQLAHQAIQERVEAETG